MVAILNFPAKLEACRKIQGSFTQMRNIPEQMMLKCFEQLSRDIKEQHSNRNTYIQDKQKELKYYKQRQLK